MFEKNDSKGNRPDFSSREGVYIWKNKDKNGKDFLSVKIPLLNISTNCFGPYEEKDTEDQKPTQEFVEDDD